MLFSRITLFFRSQPCAVILVKWSLDEARAKTIAITETAASRNFINDIYAMQLDKLDIQNNQRWLTAEDELVCDICGPADHKLKNERINDGDWNGRTWGERFPTGKAHPKCRCEISLERPKKLVIPKHLPAKKK